MLFSRYLSGSSESDKEGDGYNVCDEHGHDLRDFENDRLESEFQSINKTGYRPLKWVDSTLIPGFLLGKHVLKQRKTAQCRDCPHESIRTITVKEWFVYRDSGEVGTMAKKTYEALKSQKE